MNCCKTLFCSNTCIITATEDYHKVICGKDLAFLTAAAQGSNTSDSHLRNLLLLRILAASIQEDNTNPLHSSFTSCLTPQYTVSKGLQFSLVERIVNPIRMLETLGIDVFADPNYDTWVLQTIRNRLGNNISSDHATNKYAVALCMPAYSMFNHSCEPTVKTEVLKDGGHEGVFALRGIKKGEELFVSFGEFEGVPKWVRQEALKVWLGGPCMCSRCKREK